MPRPFIKTAGIDFELQELMACRRTTHDAHRTLGDTKFPGNELDEGLVCLAAVCDGSYLDMELGALTGEPSRQQVA
jgi:hypothetical protein